VVIANKATVSTMSTVWVDLMETSAVSAAPTSAAGSKTGIHLGALSNTAITATAGCRAIMFNVDTGATTAEAFHFGLGTKSVLFTFSSYATMIAPSTNYTATAAYFGAGSAVESTANTAEQLLLDNLKTSLMSTRLCIGGPNVFKFTTPSTDALLIEVVNSTSGPITFSNTMSTETIVGLCAEVAVGFDITADQLTSTLSKRFIGVKTSTTNQICQASVTVVRSKGRYIPCMPGNFVGVLSS